MFASKLSNENASVWIKSDSLIGVDKADLGESIDFAHTSAKKTIKDFAIDEPNYVSPGQGNRFFSNSKKNVKD